MHEVSLEELLFCLDKDLNLVWALSLVTFPKLNFSGSK